MTSETEMSMARSTSCTDARMTRVRSMITLTCSDGEMEARNHGNVAFTLSAVSIMLEPGWRKMARITPGLPLEMPRLRVSSTESVTVAMSTRRVEAPAWPPTMSGSYSYALKSWSLSEMDQLRSVVEMEPLARLEFAACNALRTVSRL